jgi:tol-pal system protein YbgF
MFKKSAGLLIFLFLFLAGWSAAPGQSKKAYELIYEDIQLLKKQILAVEEKLDKTADEVLALKDQLKELQAQIKLLLSEQADSQGEMKKIPAQNQMFLEKLDLLSQQLNKISEDLLVLKQTAPPLTGPGQDQTKKESQDPKQSREAKKTETKTEIKTGPTEKKPPTTAVPSISPQEVYNMAYADYLDGNFDLAIDGFKTYRQHFSDSPLADNALYWIGECNFSQKKHEEAINTFNELIMNYPQSDKAAAAFLKKGLCLVELGKKDEALSVFKLLVGKFPMENETKIAQQKIKELTGK